MACLLDPTRCLPFLLPPYDVWPQFHLPVCYHEQAILVFAVPQQATFSNTSRSGYEIVPENDLGEHHNSAIMMLVSPMSYID